MTPALMALFAIEYRYDVSRLRMPQKLAQRREATLDAGRSLYCVQTTYQVERVYDKKVK